jgi:murein DD-endopeptidase MepM/ murein hydrolase activator NlpD
MRAILAFVAGVALGVAAAVALLRTGVPASSETPAVPAAVAPVPSAPPAEGPVAPPTFAPPAETSLLGVPRESPVPGDAADATLTPEMLLPPAVRPAMNVPSVGDLDRLRERRILFPLPGYDVTHLRDNFAEARGGRVHEALDIAAPRGTPVLAVDDGVVKKLFTSKPGGLTVYQFDPSETYSYYYAHLDRYAEGLKEGARLRKGDVLGYVGTTGNAPPNVPHLHFTVFKLDADKRWWQGTAMNPYPLWALR